MNPEVIKVALKMKGRKRSLMLLSIAASEFDTEDMASHIIVACLAEVMMLTILDEDNEIDVAIKKESRRRLEIAMDSTTPEELIETTKILHDSLVLLKDVYNKTHKDKT